ncbi:uncharacterized protein TRIADDRAFT_55679 [Trichoplax adhaerens]|uniref:Tonsoku-like protein n=1 Tax=Trichoplax adhaerens TaxID=10228 RepID=B3RVJ8_TRIAD|nr:hypothetical protein TRIADDRAFT_55679 [Trichoplax adhaerens]EDV26008.1 hypothetical protein TRIADDRAFT_55679 [Trichoplax adhaerens]|eukprot:XP_002112041.1 hypothetical protein TRIADDRAFT_55679 [Trichoplax adhaerens]
MFYYWYPFSPVEEQRALATLGRTHFLEAEHYADDPPKQTESLSMAHQAYIDSLSVCDLLGDCVVEHELQQMRARLYLNLGLIFEIKQELSKASKYTHKSLTIARDFKLKDTEYRALYTLGGIYMKSDDYSNAKEMFSLAVASDQVKDNSVVESDILENLGQVNIKLSNFKEAKRVFKKAYKLRYESTEDTKTSLRANFKLATKGLELQRKLADLESLDQNGQLKLMENLGDFYSKIEVMEKAIYYYKQQLDIALSLSIEGESLADIYVSLALSYADAKQYKDAIEFYERELKIGCRKPQEECKTWLNIAQLLEDSSHDFQKINECYENALRLAKASNNPPLIIKVLKALADFQKKFSRIDLQERSFEEINRIKKEYDIESDSSDLDDDDITDDPVLIDSDDSISDSEISDCLEEYDKLLPDSTTTRKRRRLKRYKEKVNDKGETPLHIAAIKGDLKVIKALVEQGAKINARDNCGWTPLHEACNFGYKDIAEYLVNHGADVNSSVIDSQWGMVTPLLDAIQNYHLDTVKMLLEKGASLSLSADKGRLLLKRLQSELESQSDHDGSEGNTDDDVIKEMIALVRNATGLSLNSTVDSEKSGNTNDRNGVRVTSSDTDDNDVSSALVAPKRTKGKSRLSGNIFSNIGRNRLNCQNYDTDSEDDHRRKFSKSSHVDSRKQMYSSDESVNDNYMQLETEGERQLNGIKRSTALISEIDYHVDWLIDDIKETTTKRKKKTQSTVIGDSRKERKGSREGGTKRKSGRTTNYNATQYTMADQFSTNFQDSSADNDEDDGRAFIDNFEKPPATLNTGTSVMRIRVKIQDKTFLIPCGTENDRRTVSWLLEQTSNRYFNCTGMRPLVMILSNKQGALLSAEDCLFDVLSNNEETIANVESWDLPPLKDRYVSCCQNLDIEPHSQVIMALDTEMRSQSLDLKNTLLNDNDLLPISQSLQGFTLITTLVLSGNCIGDKGFKLLAPIFKTAHNLVTVDLASNGITDDGLNYFVDYAFSGTTTDTYNTSLGKLQELNLSFNPLGDGSSTALASLLNNCKRMVKLYIESCLLTPAVMNHREGLKHGLKHANGLQSLSLSGNHLGSVGMQHLLDCLPCTSLVWLGLNSIDVELRDGGVMTSLKDYLLKSECALTTLELAGNYAYLDVMDDLAAAVYRLKAINLGCCNISDPFMYSLARYIPSAGINQLILQGNSGITIDGLDAMVKSLCAEQKQLELLDLSACGVTSPMRSDILDLLLMPCLRRHDIKYPECVTKDLRLSFNRINTRDKQELHDRWIKGWGAERAKEFCNENYCILYV